MLTSGNVTSDMDEDHHDSSFLSCHKEAGVAQEAPRNVDVLRMKTARMEYSEVLSLYGGILLLQWWGWGSCTMKLGGRGLSASTPQSLTRSGSQLYDTSSIRAAHPNSLTASEIVLGDSSFQEAASLGGSELGALLGLGRN